MKGSVQKSKMYSNHRSDRVVLSYVKNSHKRKTNRNWKHEQVNGVIAKTP